MTPPHVGPQNAPSLKELAMNLACNMDLSDAGLAVLLTALFERPFRSLSVDLSGTNGGTQVCTSLSPLEGVLAAGWQTGYTRGIAPARSWVRAPVTRGVERSTASGRHVGKALAARKWVPTVGGLQGVGIRAFLDTKNDLPAQYDHFETRQHCGAGQRNDGGRIRSGQSTVLHV